MIEKAKVAVVGVGNNISALVQGIAFYRASSSLVGIYRPVIDGLGVADIDFVAAFAISADKVGKDLTEAIFLAPNNFPCLETELPPSGVRVERGLTDATEVDRVAKAVAGAEVMLYAAPSGLPEVARAYAEAALRAGVAFINTTSDVVARDPQWIERFEAAGLPLLGDDLTYQVNLGGTEDIRNLAQNGSSKKQSKLNALTSDQSTADKLQMAPIGYLSQLKSEKVAYLNIEAQGWGETSVSLDIKLKVHDPSGAAGVTIDLIRMATSALRNGRGGYTADAAPLLKSPPGTAP